MSRAEVHIREADLGSPDDCAGLIAILDSYASDPVGGGQPLAPEVRERLIPGLREQPSVLVLLAFTGERPVGAAVCFFGFSTFSARPLLNVHDIAVLPGHRGRGIGRALLASVETRARERGCCKLTLEVQDSNRRARALYDRFGFGDLVFGDSGVTRFLVKPLEESA